MGDLARLELEELYLGVPDDSVNLTFQDLAEVEQKSGKKKPTPSITIMEAIEEVKTPKHPSSAPIEKLPSLDFNRALQASSKPQYRDGDGDDHRHYGYHNHDHHRNNHHRNHVVESSIRAFDDMSISGVSMGSNFQDRGRGGRRRPGIPHSNICTICTTYVYIFRHRCLVCGRVYCRNCVTLGMGEMTEGRKCLDCLGRRFSQRYINKAGKVGCWSRYPSMVKQAELKWAEKGPRRSGERAYGSVVMSRSRSPMTPARPHPPPFVIPSSPYSPYSHYATPNRYHHLPFPI